MCCLDGPTLLASWRTACRCDPLGSLSRSAVTATSSGTRGRPHPWSSMRRSARGGPAAGDPVARPPPRPRDAAAGGGGAGEGRLGAAGTRRRHHPRPVDEHVHRTRVAGARPPGRAPAGCRDQPRGRSSPGREGARAPDQRRHQGWAVSEGRLATHAHDSTAGDEPSSGVRGGTWEPGSGSRPTCCSRWGSGARCARLCGHCRNVARRSDQIAHDSGRRPTPRSVRRGVPRPARAPRSSSGSAALVHPSVDGLPRSAGGATSARPCAPATPGAVTTPSGRPPGS